MIAEAAAVPTGLLFFDRSAGRLPSIEARPKIIQMLEAHRLHLFTGFGAAHSDGAIHEISFVGVERADLFNKPVSIDINIDCSTNVTFLEFRGTSHVEQNVIRVGSKTFIFFDANALNAFRRLFGKHPTERQKQRSK